MKHLIIVLASVIGICYTTQSFAQTADEEVIIKNKNIILDNKNNESETTIEIKNGKLYVDGKKVSDIDKNTTVNIVKKNTTTEDNDLKLNLDDFGFLPNFKNSLRVPRKVLLGVYTENANPGALVTEVAAGSAAEKAGLQKGDIILSIDKKNIDSSAILLKTIGKYDAGDKIRIEIQRNAKTKELVATLEANKQEVTSSGARLFDDLPSSMNGFFDYPGMVGLTTKTEMSDAPKIGLEVEESSSGLEVKSVQPNSAAQKAGIEKGDYINTIEGATVSSLEELQTSIEDHQDNKKINIGIKRNGATKILPVEIPRAKKRATF